MNTRTRIALGAAAVTAASAATFLTTEALAAPAPPVSTTILANKVPIAALNLHAHITPTEVKDWGLDLDTPWGLNLETRGTTDGYVVDNVLPPGSSTGWHTHPGPSLIFVIKGTVTNFMSDDPSCTGTAYGAGSSFVDGGGSDSHTLKNLGTDAAETIAVQLLPHGAPRKLPADVPPNCQ